MPEWKHPDELDRLAASGSAGPARSRASPAEVVMALNKALVTGRLERIPRKPGHRDILLALLCLHMRRRYPYTELEINGYLKEALKIMGAVVDHVTCRRHLVDFGFLKRDRAGNRYLLNYRKITSTLSDEALSSADVLLKEVVGTHAVPQQIS